MKDIQGQIRRDVQEWKEAYYSQWLTQRILSVLDFTQLNTLSQELTLSFNVMVDDGNLTSALNLATLDLLNQLNLTLKKPLFFTVMLLQAIEGQLIVDPTHEEMHISNNILVVTCYSDGTQAIEKTLGYRTYTGASNVQPLE